MPTTFPPSRSPLSSPPLSSLPLPKAPPPLFMVSRRAESGGSIRIIVAGELDLTARPHFESALAAAQEDADRVLLDLGALTFIDCTCLGALFTAARRGRREGGALILLAPRGQVRRLLDLVGPMPGTAVLDHSDLPRRRVPVAA